jgi:RNA polymerase sigma factor (sigma-70 family)
MPAVEEAELRRLAAAAANGDHDALSEVVAAVRDGVYRLALRMFWDPPDAEDATQEALIRIITRIGSYRGEAAFSTWSYRVAANHMINWRQSRTEREHLTFRRFGEQLDDGLTDPNPVTPEDHLLAVEVKLGCTLGMLLCLDRDHRLAYVLSDVFELSSADGAYVCSISPAAFRKRASRARQQLRKFTAEHCGLVDRNRACRCDRRVATALDVGRLRPDHLLFAGGLDPATAVTQMEQLHDLSSLMHSHPDYEPPARLTAAVQEIIDSGRFTILDEQAP